MLDFYKENKKENLIIFVHGLGGNNDTWLSTNRNTSVLGHLEQKNIQEQFDIALFEYYTEILTAESNLSKILSLISKSFRFKKIAPITDLGLLLLNEIQWRCNQYKKIAILAHSMGGLIAKSCILQEIEQRGSSQVSIFFSLDVPHSGADLASLGRRVFKNSQLEDLASQAKVVDDLSRRWIEMEQHLPPTIYFQVLNDNIVKNTSAVAFEGANRTKQKQYHVVMVDHDHSSIIKPKSIDDLVVAVIFSKCLEIAASAIHQPKLDINTEAGDQTDEELFKKHLQAFDRPAFQMPCIHELSLEELLVAVNDTILAINTGKLYARDNKLIDEYPSARHFKNAVYNETFHEIIKVLATIKFYVLNLKQTFERKFKNEKHTVFNFYQMFRIGLTNLDSDVIKAIVQDMDKIDILRNKVITILNHNSSSKLKLIPLSSTILQSGQMGGEINERYLGT